MSAAGPLILVPGAELPRDPRLRDLSPLELLVLAMLCDETRRKIEDSGVAEALETLRERGMALRHTKMSRLGIHVRYEPTPFGRAEYERRKARRGA